MLLPVKLTLILLPAWLISIPGGQAVRPPTPIMPENHAVMDNGCRNMGDPIEWEFKWSAVPKATSYHLHVIGALATKPVINNSRLSDSMYRHKPTGGYIIKRHQRGWRWRVRAFVNGAWSEWSEERTFDVEPVDTDCPVASHPQVDGGLPAVF